MSKHLIGYVFNKALNKNIPVYLPTIWNNIMRVPEVVDQAVKTAALATVKAPLKNGTLFKFEDMQKMDELLITNTLHQSQTDPNNHCSVQGQTTGGVRIKANHAQEDQSKQYVAN
ncbi:hypothetical protein N7471_013411 [Penicillium samsonianum]|uniref:uncharacterized protein n=1 Tax=Penicillium samsonianum TaxID=1882272 RepID=UPI0025489E23|nr:uncharacterized protein N7471_013411 [Penicillium samsonianum]KAJ6118791.1 hypothetical protein N7471_013411 [Penicillium samsonianum]